MRDIVELFLCGVIAVLLAVITMQILYLCINAINPDLAHYLVECIESAILVN